MFWFNKCLHFQHNVWCWRYICVPTCQYTCHCLCSIGSTCPQTCRRWTEGSLILHPSVIELHLVSEIKNINHYIASLYEMYHLPILLGRKKSFQLWDLIFFWIICFSSYFVSDPTPCSYRNSDEITRIPTLNTNSINE